MTEHVSQKKSIKLSTGSDRGTVWGSIHLQSTRIIASLAEHAASLEISSFLLDLCAAMLPQRRRLNMRRPLLVTARTVGIFQHTDTPEKKPYSTGGRGLGLGLLKNVWNVYDQATPRLSLILRIVVRFLLACTSLGEFVRPRCSSEVLPHTKEQRLHGMVGDSACTQAVISVEHSNKVAPPGLHVLFCRATHPPLGQRSLV